MNTSEALSTVTAFRTSLYGCFGKRADAMFELVDTVLTADTVPSFAHLSLEACHRRSWGSLYAALRHGQVDAEALRGLLASHPLEGGQPIYAVDVSVWPRCDAETSPERGYYYHPSRHSNGKPPPAGAGTRRRLGLPVDRTVEPRA